jgi:predicted Holliday junction resolvase-like endonuclease
MLEIVLSVSVTLLLGYIAYRYRLHYIRKGFNVELEKASKVAIEKSKSVIRGQVSEQLVPLFNDFPYTLSDIKFSGQPIDYLVFDGMSGVRDGNSGEITIIFADVKTGVANKSKVQREISNAIKNGRIRFETWVVNNGKLEVK